MEKLIDFPHDIIIEKILCKKKIFDEENFLESKIKEFNNNPDSIEKEARLYAARKEYDEAICLFNYSWKNFENLTNRLKLVKISEYCYRIKIFLKDYLKNKEELKIYEKDKSPKDLLQKTVMKSLLKNKIKSLRKIQLKEKNIFGIEIENILKRLYFPEEYKKKKYVKKQIKLFSSPNEKITNNITENGCLYHIPFKSEKYSQKELEKIYVNLKNKEIFEL